MACKNFDKMTDETPCKKVKLEKDNEETKAEEKSPNKEATSKSVSQTIEVTNSTSANNVSNTTSLQQRPKLTFKNPKFSYIEPGGKKFVWKSLKQIVTQEKSLPWPENVVLC